MPVTMPMNRQPTVRRRAARTQRGVMLIEALIVILIFSFGLLGMVSLQARASKIAVGAQDSNRAAMLASELSAQMWAYRTVSLAPAVLTAWQTRLTSADSDMRLPGNATGTVTALASGGARITITWRPPAATQDSRYVADVFVN